MGDVVSHYLGRTALSKRIFTGLQPRRLGKLVAELAGTWMASEESRLRERRGHERLRAPGAGPDHGLVFVDRVIVTLVALRIREPGLKRGFRVPGGMAGAILAGVFPLALLSLAMVESNHETVLGINGLLFGVLIIMAGFLIYFATGKLKIRKTKPVVIQNIEELETA